MTGSHFFAGLLLTAALNILAGAAALAVTWRANLAGRAERALSALMTWNFLVMVPVYALGLTNLLYARTLSWVAALVFVLVLLLARGRTPLAQFEAELGRIATDIAWLPYDAVVKCARARSLAAVAVVFAMAVVLWGLGCTYLMPSWKQWDALWYHEPMVGFAIQNHGFAFTDLPPGGAQKINGYPRLAEMTMLWFVIFTDRRFIDMVSYIAAPGLALATYILVRRVSRDSVMAMAFGCILVVTPACVRVTGSTYVDAQNAAFVLAGAAFATRRNFRIRDAMLTAVCLALAGASKALAVVPVAALAVVAMVRLSGEARRRPKAVAGAIALGFVLIAGIAATTYVRNWVHFHNPLWPDVKVESARWGIHWPGELEWGANQPEKSFFQRVDVNLPFWDFMDSLFRIPYSYSAPYLDIMWEYGLAMTWVVLPLTVLGLGALCLAVARDAAGRLQGVKEWQTAPETWSLIPLALTFVACVRTTPVLWIPRYQIAVMGLALATVAWLVGRPVLRGIGQGVVGALTAMTIVSFFWMTPRTWLWGSEAFAFAKIPYPAREFTPASAISPKLEKWNASPVTLEVGLAREKELTAGSVLAFPQDYGVYMALFWNNTYSNRAVYIPPGPDYLERLKKSDATWAYCASGDPACSSLGQPSSGWELVGHLDVENRGSVFRRAGR
ncbi:MAG: hypothetical protein ABTD50_18565 [Polyangiaceae bacterium]|jgi:hypothetical protein